MFGLMSAESTPGRSTGWPVRTPAAVWYVSSASEGVASTKASSSRPPCAPDRSVHVQYALPGPSLLIVGWALAGSWKVDQSFEVSSAQSCWAFGRSDDPTGPTGADGNAIDGAATGIVGSGAIVGRGVLVAALLQAAAAHSADNTKIDRTSLKTATPASVRRR